MPQILQSAKAQLGAVLRQRLDAAVAAGEAREVLRFTKLFKPLRMQARIRPYNSKLVIYHVIFLWLTQAQP